MGRIIFNEDPNHFIFSRARAGKAVLTDADIMDFIRQYKDTDITDFMLCVNASITWYDSKKTKNIMTQYKEWLRDGKISENESDLVVRSIRLLCDYYDRTGEVPQDVWIRELREMGIRPWTSIRMNDIHETDREESILFSDFYRQNRHQNRASHRGAVGYYEYGLDYMQKEVREHYLTVIEEALMRFDTDGLELDWMREIYSVGIGREHEGIAVINAFMEEVYAMVKRMEKVRGHKIGIAVRLPDTPEKALRLGFDVFDWVEKGMLDIITVTPRWSSVDNDMPMDLWARIFRGKGVVIAAGLEILLDAYNRRGRRYLANTYETAVGSCCAGLFAGADAIYLFNYMDVPEETPPTANADDMLRGEVYHRFLTVAGDREKTAMEKRRHVVTYNDVSAIGANGKKQLPVTLRGDGKPMSYPALRLVTGEIPAGRGVELLLGVESVEKFDPKGLTVYISARPCKLIGEREPVHQQYDDLRYFAFAIENDGGLSPVSIIEMGLCEGFAVVHWVEIDIT